MENKQLKPLFVKVEEQQIVRDEVKQQIRPEDKTYIILYYMTIDTGEDIKSFEVVTGRKNAYEYIKGIVEYLDIHDSKVMVDNVPYAKAISVYEFMKLMSNHFMEDSFDIEDYNIGDEI